MDMPEGYKNFSKTKPILLEHFKPVIDLWTNREEITVDESPKSKKYSIDEIKSLGTISSLDANIDRVLGEIMALSGEKDEG